MGEGRAQAQESWSLRGEVRMAGSPLQLLLWLLSSLSSEETAGPPLVGTRGLTWSPLPTRLPQRQGQAEGGRGSGRASAHCGRGELRLPVGAGLARWPGCQAGGLRRLLPWSWVPASSGPAWGYVSSTRWGAQRNCGRREGTTFLVP